MKTEITDTQPSNTATASTSALHRRQFLKLLGGAAVVGSLTPDVLARPRPVSITILHTNDVHSRLDPFPQDGSRNAGRGGVARRAALIERIRAEQKNILLFDAGDIFQGTPYFNVYKGEPEILAMNRMGYDAGTIGNHDFDGGIDNMREQFAKAKFQILVANYNFRNTVMDGRTEPYRIFTKDGIRIGVFGLGIKPEGLIPQSLYKETRYLDPLEIGNETAAILRNQKKCDYVICLSHLGFDYRDDTISDKKLAAKSRNIDFIIGGHTHTFLDAPVSVTNQDGHSVLINQVGWAGINLGRVDLLFEPGKKTSTLSSKPIEVK